MADLSMDWDTCRNLADLIELYIFQYIRDDEDIDNMEWLISVVDAYKVFRQVENEHNTKGE